MAHRMITLALCMLTSMTALAQEYRAIVETPALQDPAMNVVAANQAIHVYKPGDLVSMKHGAACSMETCAVILPDGREGWIASHQITRQTDIAAARSYYEKVKWDEMSKFQLRIWAKEKEDPAVMHYCAIKLVSGVNLAEAGSYEAFCNHFRHTLEVQTAARVVRESLAAMNLPEDRKKLLSGGVPIGAPKAAALLAWGEPKDINRTMSNSMAQEKWVYDDRQAYIENDKVTAIHD